MLGLFNVVERTIKDAEDCVLVQSQLPIINSLRVEAYRRMDVESQIIRERPPENPYGDGTAYPEKPKDKPVSPPVPQRTTKVINEISFFKSGKMLENETDIEEYVTQLREKLLIILKEKNIRV